MDELNTPVRDAQEQRACEQLAVVVGSNERGEWQRVKWHLQTVFPRATLQALWGVPPGQVGSHRPNLERREPTKDLERTATPPLKVSVGPEER